MQLSDNFTLNELTKSQTASRKGINNEPSTEHVENLIHLAKTILQPVREHFGRQVIISSGYRSPELCEAIGSSVKSQHAMDNRFLAKWISENCDFDQLILEFYIDGDPNSGWVHCSSTTGSSRKEILKAERKAGKVSYSRILF